MSKRTVHIGSAYDVGRRFTNAYRRAANGDDFEERHITFLSLEEMMAAITPKRLELLRYLHKHSVSSISDLARALCRDYKRVHSDVKTLETVGLIVREDDRIGAPWETLSAEVTL